MQTARILLIHVRREERLYSGLGTPKKRDYKLVLWNGIEMIIILLAILWRCQEASNRRGRKKPLRKQNIFLCLQIRGSCSYKMVLPGAEECHGTSQTWRTFRGAEEALVGSCSLSGRIHAPNPVPEQDQWVMLGGPFMCLQVLQGDSWDWFSVTSDRLFNQSLSILIFKMEIIAHTS